MTIKFFGDTEAQDETWSGLVDLLRRHLQPRLYAQIVGTIRAGRVVNIAGVYMVDSRGLHYPRNKKSYNWSDINVVVERGRVRLRPVGPARTCPYSHPRNAIISSTWTGWSSTRCQRSRMVEGKFMKSLGPSRYRPAPRISTSSWPDTM